MNQSDRDSRLPSLSRVARRGSFTLASVIAVTTGVVLWGPATTAGVVGVSAQADATQHQFFVSVLDDDRPVLGLGIDDFVVEEDGDRREILRVEPASMPVDLAILVDEGMAASANIAHIREALTTLVVAMQGHDVSLMSFGNQKRLIVPFTKDTERLTQATRNFSGFSESSSFLLDAMIDTARDLARRDPQRPAMVVLTGADRGTDDLAIRGQSLGNAETLSRLTPEATRDRSAEVVVEGLVNSGVVVNAVVMRSLDATVGFNDNRNSGLNTVTSGAGAFRWIQENGERERVIDQAPTETGGRLYKVSSTSGIEERLVRIADELINQYLVTYARPGTLVPPDEVEVDTVENDYTVRSARSLTYIPYVSPTVYVLDGTVVEPDMVYHHSPECPGFGGVGGQYAVPVTLDALGPNGQFCPYCPKKANQEPDDR